MDFELASMAEYGEVGVLLVSQELAGGRAGAFGDNGGVVVFHRCSMMM